MNANKVQKVAGWLGTVGSFLYAFSHELVLNPVTTVPALLVTMLSSLALHYAKPGE